MTNVSLCYRPMPAIPTNLEGCRAAFHACGITFRGEGGNSAQWRQEFKDKHLLKEEDLVADLRDFLDDPSVRKLNKGRIRRGGN